jgi:hypothetical protein
LAWAAARRGWPVQLGNRLVAQLLDLGDGGRGRHRIVVVELDRITGDAKREPGDEEGDDAQEHEQPHRADIAHAAAGEVFAGDVRGFRQ